MSTSPDRKPNGSGVEPTSSSIDPPRASTLDRPGSLSRLFGKSAAVEFSRQNERRRLILIVGVPALVGLIAKLVFDKQGRK